MSNTNTALDRRRDDTPVIRADAIESRVIESVIVRGDISALSPNERATYYVELCKSLGLSAAAQPFAPLKLNGKEILYPTRGATDQLAAMHRINREIIDGPRVIDVAGTKLVFAVCRATHPNGRTETATATVPLVDPANVLMKCECVPLDSEILTRRGFKTYDQVRIGEEVLAYDVETDKCEWVELENVSVYHAAPVARLHTEQGGFSFRCTPNHSWAARKQEYKPRASARAPRGPRTDRAPEGILVQADSIKTSHRVVIAAPCHEGDHPLSPERAAVLGWVMTDGTIRRRGSFVSLVIYQSKQQRIAEIRALLTAAGYPVRESVGQPTVREFPGGSTYECLPQHSFRLSAVESRELLRDAGIESPADLSRLVTRLSPQARASMLAAMMAADATSKGVFGKKRKPGVMDAWQILCTLQGIALGRMGISSAGDVPTQKALESRHVGGNNLLLTPDGVESVWCPTTKHGTWVMRQSGRISITGNTKAKRRATLSILGLGMLDETEIDSIPANAKSEALPIKVEAAKSSRSKLSDEEKAERVAAIIDEYRAALARDENADAAFDAAKKRGGAEGVATLVQAALQREISETAAKKRAEYDAQQTAYSRLVSELDSAETSAAVIAVWTDNAAAIKQLPEQHRRQAWSETVARWSAVGGEGNGQGLRDALNERGEP